MKDGKNQFKTIRLKEQTHFRVEGVKRKRKLKTFESALEYLIQLGMKADKNQLIQNN